MTEAVGSHFGLPHTGRPTGLRLNSLNSAGGERGERERERGEVGEMHKMRGAHDKKFWSSFIKDEVKT
jgi:hypothetical protein